MFAYAEVKRHLEQRVEEQFWAKDIVARAVSAKRASKVSNLMLIGPKGCGKRATMEVISKFLHVPLLIVRDAHQLGSHRTMPERYVSVKLLEYSSYDVETAASGVVVFCNVNRFDVDLQRSIGRLMRDEISLRIREIFDRRCPAELLRETFETRNVLIAATIDCDIEGKIARRYANDVIDRAVNRENAITTADLIKMNVCEELAENFNYIAPFHCRDDQLLRTPFCQI